MIKRIFHVKSNGRIFIYFTIAVCFIVLLLTFVFLNSFSQTIKQESIRVTDNTLKKSGRNLEQYLEQVKELSIILESDSVVNDYFTKSEASSLYEQEIEKMLINVVAIKPDIVSIILVGRDGRIVSNEKNLPMKLSSDMMGMPWYSETLASSGKPLLTSARMQDFSSDKNTWVISLCREIKAADGTNAGLILIDLDYKVIEDVLGDLDLGTKGYAFVINDKGEPVYHKDISYFTDKDKALELKQSALFDSTKGNDFVKRSYHLSNADWLVVAYDSLDSINMIQSDVFYVVVISTIILVGLASFSSLKAKRLMNDITRKEKILRETELSVLQNQINPHFLYNSLETIIWMAEFKESNKVIEITKSLARFFRLSLSSGTMVSLENEIEHVKKYLKIQEYRYEDLLRYEINIDEALYSWKVPKLVLQPIVENAIDHGIRGKKNGGLISITARINNDHLEIIVVDDGVGFVCKPDYFLPTELMLKSDKLYKKNDTLNNNKLSAGIGLKNVAMRVRLFGDDSCGILMNSEINKGTKVTIIIK